MRLRRLAACAAIVFAVGGGDAGAGEDAPAPAEQPSLTATAERRTKRRNLRGEGGSAQTERAVERALAWLALEQRTDGAWPSGSLSQHGTGVTGLALLAFLGHGHGPDDDLYGTTVRRGLDLLLSRQKADGFIGEVAPALVPQDDGPEETMARLIRERQRRPGAGEIYDHLAATEALIDAVLLVGDDDRLRDAAQRAVSYLFKAQNPYLAWRYRPRSGDNDTSVTGWTMHVLWLAEQCGLEGDFVNGRRGGIAWLDKMTEPEFGRVGYQRRGGEMRGFGTSVTDFGRELAQHPVRADDGADTRGPAMTALALSARLHHGQRPAGHGKRENMSARSARFLAGALPRWGEANEGVDMYFWYWGTRAARRHGGKLWRDWNHALRAILVKRQIVDGEQAGSWAPVGPWGMAGSSYSTALCCLSLESYYRYDPKAGR